MSQCPACRRPVAAIRPTCLYCGAALPAEALAEAETLAAAQTAPPASARVEKTGRMLLVLDLTGRPPQVLEKVLGLDAFEAGQRARAGGLHLHRIGDESEITAEAHRLEGLGLPSLSFPELEARYAPVVALGGGREEAVLHLKSSAGGVEVHGEDLLLVVEGPIQREYQAREVERKKPRAATLEAGHRFHLHRRSNPRPVELDPANFSFSDRRGMVAGSSLLEMKDWIAALGGPPVDDTFRRLPVALAPALPSDDASSLIQNAGRGLGRDKNAVPILDNLAQFRFWSGWRAAAFRRLAR